MNISLLLNSDIANFVLETIQGKEGVLEWGCRRPDFLIFVFWGALIVVG